MSTSFLLSILFITLLSGIVMFIVMMLKKKDGSKYDKISAIASFLATVSSLIVGIATIKALSFEEVRDRIQNQPLYSVSINQNYSEEKSFYDNEEFVVVNEGKKTKSSTEVHHFAFLEISYTNSKKHEPTITRYCPLDHYFGANFVTYNLDGRIVSSGYSGNNNELFYNLYMEALSFGKNHPGVSLFIEKCHYFKIDYTDIYGDRHTIVKTEKSEIEEKQLAEISRKADIDSKGKSFNIQHLDLDEILRVCLPEALE